MDQSDIDLRIQRYYTEHFSEADRLTCRSAQGALEITRVRELVTGHISSESRVLGVGGATGIHAAHLASLGHQVTLIDPVEAQVKAAQRHGTFRAQVGDARRLGFDDDSFDVALLFGPLYHLRDRDERLVCLREAARVVTAGGWVFAAAIPRFVGHAALSLAEETPHPYPRPWIELLEYGTPPPPDVRRFPGGHFHTAEELEQECAEVGLIDINVVAIEGPGGLALEQLPESDDDLLLAALKLVRATGQLPGIRDISNHIMAAARVP